MAEKRQQQAKQAQIIQERDLGNGPDEKALLGSLNSIDKVIAVMSGKGGVGKSTVTALIATNLARSGKKVGVLDADITGPSQGKAFGIKSVQVQSCAFGMIPLLSAEGIKIMSINFLLPSEDDPVIWRGPMLAGAVKQFYEEVHWEDLDYMIVDLPPGTGDVPLTVMQSLPITGAVLVSSPQDLALMVVRKTMKMAGKLGVPILGLVENMSYFTCPSCNAKHEIFGTSKGARIAAEADLPFLGRLGWDPLLNVLMDKGSIEHYQNFEIDLVMKELTEALES